MEVRKEFTDFQSGNKLELMLGRRWLAIWVHSNSLIRNSTPFEDDTYSFTQFSNVCKQPEDTFIKMSLLKIDFYFQVFNQIVDG